MELIFQSSLLMIFFRNSQHLLRLLRKEPQVDLILANYTCVVQSFSKLIKGKITQHDCFHACLLMLNWSQVPIDHDEKVSFVSYAKKKVFFDWCP